MQKDNLVQANEFCMHHHIEMSFIYSLHEYGLVEIQNEGDEVFIPTDQLCTLEKLVRLHYELDINMEGIDVIQHLLQKLESTQEEMAQLKTQLKFYQPNQ